MEVTIPGRVFDKALRGMLQFTKDLFLALLLGVSALVYSALSHKLSWRAIRENAWETLLPWVWALCAYSVWHILKGAVAVYKDEQEALANKSRIVITDRIRHSIVYIPAPSFRLKLYAVGLTYLCVPIFCSYLIWNKANSHFDQPPPEVPTGIAIFYDCQLFSVPISIPPKSEIHLLPLNHKRMVSQNWGLSDIRNPSDQQVQWPGKERMELAKRQQELGTFGYKCDFSNLSHVDFLNVAVPLNLWFDNGAGGTNAVKYTPILSPLAAGSHFIFYVVDDCSTNVSATFPKSVDLSIAGESGRRNIPLNRPNRNPLEQIMMLFPTKTQWVGETPCEQGS